MDEAFYVPAAILSALVMSVHLYVHKSSKPDLPSLVNCVLHSSGIVAGFVLILSTFVPSLRASLQHMSVYIAIGGLAVLFVSIQGVYRAIRGN